MKSLLSKYYAYHCCKNSPQSRKQRHRDLIGVLTSSHCRLTDIPVSYSAAARSKPQPGTSYPEFLWFYSVPQIKPTTAPLHSNQARPTRSSQATCFP